MRIKLIAVITLLLGCLTACGVGQGSGVSIGSGDPIKVGVIPVADFAPVYIALDRGYFADAGLNVEVQVMQNAAAIAPSVINGQLQFGTAAITPFVAAAKKGLPLRAVADMADVATTPAADPSALVTTAQDITRPRDLEGRTVAVNALSSIVHIAAAQVIAADGGDPAKVSFVAMPFPDMVSALQQGKVDAASLVEPFSTITTGGGAHVIANPYSATFTPGESFAVMFTAQPFIDKNPKVVKSFVAALAKASTLASEDPTVVQEVLVKYGKLKPAIAKAIRMPHYGTTIAPDALTHASQVMTDLGMLPGAVDGSKLVWP